MYLSLTLHQCDYKKAKSQARTKQRSWGLDAKRDECPLTWQTVKIWIWSSLSRSKLIGSTRIWKKSKGTWMQSVFKKKKNQWCGLSLRLKRQVENVQRHMFYVVHLNILRLALYSLKRSSAVGGRHRITECNSHSHSWEDQCHSNNRWIK